MKNICPKCGDTGRRAPATLDSPDGLECECRMEFKEMSEHLNDMYTELERRENEVCDYNKSILNEIEIIFNVDSIKEDFNNLIDFVDVVDKMEIVNKPKGDNQDEECGIFTKVFVDQYTVGMSGDSYAGFIYGKFAKNKWLKIPYEC